MVVKIGWYPTSTQQSPDEIVNLAVVAEKCGFESLWLTDHGVLCPAPPSTAKDLTPDVYVVLSTIASKTQRIRLGPGVTDPYRRHPFSTAQTIATIDYLSKGRALLAIGAGHKDMLSPFGIEVEHPVDRLREAIELMRLLWTRKDASYEGKYFKLKFVGPLYPNLCSAIVQKPYPPVYIGSISGQKMRELTGEVADGFFPYLCPPRLYRKWVCDIRNGAKRAGRNVGQIDTCAFVNVALSKDNSTSLKEAKRLKESVVGYAYLFDQLGYEPIDVSARYDARNKAEEVPFELVEELAAIGSIEDCIDKIEEYVKAGATHILIRKITPKDYRMLFKTFGEHVIPHFSS